MAEEAWKALGPGQAVRIAIRIKVGFDVALIYLKEGHEVKRQNWISQTMLLQKDGKLVFMPSKQRVHSLAVGDLLAEDWEIF